MKRILFAILCAVTFCVTASAQTPQFGYFSYDSVLTSMRSYLSVQAQLEELRLKYDEEAKRSEKDFNLKYEEFLENQSSYPEAILQKRLSELQNQMQRNIDFRSEARRLLAEAEAEAMAPLRERINDAVKAMGERFSLAFIINTDGNACPYINPDMGIDVTPAIKEHLSR